MEDELDEIVDEGIRAILGDAFGVFEATTLKAIIDRANAMLAELEDTK